MSQALIEQSLEIVADRAGDISARIFTRYFEKCPESEVLMSHMDRISRGKLMEEVFRLVLVEDYSEEQDYLTWEVKNHELAYSARPFMYENLFAALVDTISECLSDDWDAAIEAAWREKVAMLLGEIVPRFSGRF